MRPSARHSALLAALLLSACQHKATHDPAPSPPVNVHTPVDVPDSSSSAPSSLAPPPAVSLPSTPRVYIKNRFVFVRPRPDANADWLGFLWFGASVELRRNAPVGGPGCGKFYAIEPQGFVCVDEKQATLNVEDPVFKLVSGYTPQLGQAAPHRYAESLGGELRTRAPGEDRHWPALPAFFHEPRRRLLPLSTVAYLDEKTIEGEPWLLTADLLWLKKAQVTPYPEVTFHGVELSDQLHLPLAFFRRAGSVRYRRNAAGKLEKSSQAFALHSMIALGAKVEIQRGERYFDTLEGDAWVRESEAVLPTPRSVTPWGARVGQLDRTGLGPKNERQTWLEVSVLGGWLLAFEGTKPVFATLISAGRGGIPQEGKTP